MLEEAEHKRLVEKWLYEDLSAAELDRLPQEVKDKTRAYFQGLVQEARDDIEANGAVDGPEAVSRLRRNLEARRE